MRSIISKTVAAVSAFAVSGGAFAATPSNLQTFSELQTHISDTAGSIFKIAMVVVTLVGLMLVLKGIVHLKQNYTGTGQEKHLSKGIASLVFGACLFIVVPIAHVLVGGVSGDTSGKNFNSFDVQGGTAQSLGDYSS